MREKGFKSNCKGNEPKERLLENPFHDEEQATTEAKMDRNSEENTIPSINTTFPSLLISYSRINNHV